MASLDAENSSPEVTIPVAAPPLALAGQFASGTIAALVRTFRANLPLYAFATVVIVTAIVLAASIGHQVSIKSASFFAKNIAFYSATMLGFIILKKLVDFHRAGLEGSLLAGLANWGVDSARQDDKFAHFIHAFIAISVMLMGFTFLKEAVPLINPFSWDVAFYEMDKTLHFGRSPWEWLQPVFGYPYVTGFLNVAYSVWFVIMFTLLIMACCMMSNKQLRLQFLLSFMGIWFIGGNLLAIVFSSAGPCFYGPLIGGTDPYAPLMAYLHQANAVTPIWAVDTQAVLWSSYSGSETGLSGISAMPSMHVATSVLFVLMGYRLSRWLGHALAIFAVIIMIGSVQLAWHYAVDGYLGALIACAIWWVSGKFANYDLQLQSKSAK